MRTIAELIRLDYVPEEKKRRKGKVTELRSPLPNLADANPATQYAWEVFGFLLASKEALGIQTVLQFENLRVDGGIVLIDGTRMAVEIKFRMNWQKALEAGYEFRRFLLSDEAKANPVKGALVFFEEFQGSGWHSKPNCRFLENGWNEWYRNHCRFENYRLDLLRIRRAELEDFERALAKARISMPPVVAAGPGL